MKKLLTGFLLVFFLIGFACMANATIILDADSPATGSLLETTPLVTPYGTITFRGELTTLTDPDFTTAGASGNNFDIIPVTGANFEAAELLFDFDVRSISFIYGGNLGSINILAKDIGGATLDSFYQASTGNGQPAGPVTLSGLGIRSLYWEDSPTWSFAPLDNIAIDPVPEPTTMLLLGTGLVGVAGAARRKKKNQA